MRFVVSSFGSAGDFLPTLAVARTLHARGHEVLFVTNPFHEQAVRATGVVYVPAGSRVELYQRIVDEPQLLRSLSGMGSFLEELAEAFFSATYRVVRDVLRESRPDAVVGSNLSYGLFWAAAERRVHGTMIAATPVTWWTRTAPEQCLDFAVPERLLPHLVGGARSLLVSVVDAWLRSVARSVSATTIDPSLTTIERDVALHLGTWPELMRPASPSDAPNMHAVGFVRAGHLGGSAPELSSEVETFLDAGAPPVVVALGSIFSLASDEVVGDAADAAAALGHRCIIVGVAPRDRPLPKGTLVVRYATYHLLFPRAHALVIHGGAGTTGEALRAGRPAVVVPFAFDQFGISWRVQQLGVGVRVAKRARSAVSIASALREVCESEAMHARSAEVAAILGPAPDGADVAASMITRVARTPRA